MKKLSFFLMAMLFSVMSFAQDAPIYELVPATGSNNSYAGNCDITIDGIKWNLTGNSTMQPWRLGGKSITNQDRALYSKTPLAYNIDKIEVTHGTASSITVNSFKLIISDEANGAGETIDVAFKASATTTIDLPEGDYTNKYFKFLYNVTNSTSSNRYVQFTGAKFYAALAEDAVKAPIIKGAEDFISETEVTIEAEDDVTVYYTLDGTEPTNASTVYAAPFTVKETTTVKAVAYRGEKASFVTSATFTQATRVTAAEAAELAMKVASNNALTSVTYVINAYVTSVIDQTLSSGQQRFWVADTKDGGQVLQSYYCNVPQVLKVGDYIQMFGKLTKYNTSPQMKNGDVTILEEPAPEPEHTYTVAGSSATVFGTAWNANDTVNNMTKQEDGTYKLEKTELTLAAGTIEFKVVEDHNWDIAYPADNYKLTIAEDGIYTITITFNPADQAVAATATKTGDAGKIIPVIAMHGNFLGSWADTEDFTLAADEATATLTLTIAEGNYEFGVRIDGTWTSNGVAFTRENASAEIVAGSGNLKLAADVAGEYTFTWTFETNTLTVTYPVAVTTITETFDLTTEDTRNMMGTYNVYAGDYTLRIYGYTGAGTYQDDPATEEDAAPLLFTPDNEDPLNAVVVVTIDEENNKEVMQVTATSADGKKIYNLTFNIVAPEIQEHMLYITYPTITVEESPMGGVMYIIEEAEAMMDTEDNIVTVGMTIFPSMNYAEMSIGDDIYATGEALVSEPFMGEFTIEAILTDDAGNTYNVTVLAQEIKQDIEIVVAETVELNGYNMTFEMQGNMAIVTANVQGIELFFWMTMYTDDNGYGTYFNDAITNVWYGENALTPYGDEHVYSAENLKVSFINDPDAEGNVTLYNFTLYAGDQPTGVDNINTTIAPVKVIENGQIFIISNGVKYNAQGAKL